MLLAEPETTFEIVEVKNGNEPPKYQVVVVCPVVKKDMNPVVIEDKDSISYSEDDFDPFKKTKRMPGQKLIESLK